MTPQPPSQIHSFCPFSVQSSPQAVQYLSPDDAHTVLVGPICRSFYKQATCNKLLWRAMCGSEPWEIPYEHLDAMCLCSITAWSDLENKHSSEGASGGANCGFGTRRILPPFMRSSSSSSSSSFSWPHPHFAPLCGQHPRCPSSPHAASRPPRPSKWGHRAFRGLMVRRCLRPQPHRRYSRSIWARGIREIPCNGSGGAEALPDHSIKMEEGEEETGGGSGLELGVQVTHSLRGGVGGRSDRSDVGGSGGVCGNLGMTVSSSPPSAVVECTGMGFGLTRVDSSMEQGQGQGQKASTAAAPPAVGTRHAWRGRCASNTLCSSSRCNDCGCPWRVTRQK